VTLYQSAFWHTISYRALLRLTGLQSYTPERGLVFEPARLEGPHGSVVGIDIDGVKLSLAQQEAEHERLTNVAFQVRDATALDALGTYDLVYARFLLTHLRDPQMMVQQMVRAAKPGGVIVVEDLDHAAIFCHPACAALDRHIRLYNQVVRLKGADPEIGPSCRSCCGRPGYRTFSWMWCNRPLWKAAPSGCTKSRWRTRAGSAC